MPKPKRTQKPLSAGIVVDRIRALKSERDQAAQEAAEKARDRVLDRYVDRINQLLDRCPEREVAERMIAAAGRGEEVGK